MNILEFLCLTILGLYLFLNFSLALWIYRTTNNWDVVYETWVLRNMDTGRGLSRKQLRALKVVEFLRHALMLLIALLVIKTLFFI